MSYRKTEPIDHARRRAELTCQIDDAVLEAQEKLSRVAELLGTDGNDNAETVVVLRGILRANADGSDTRCGILTVEEIQALGHAIIALGG